MKYIETKVSDQMGIIVIQNPPRNNLSTPVMMELQSAFKEMEKNDAVEVVILTGKGLFSTGADVTEIWQIAQSNDVEKAKELLAKANSVANTIEDLTKPVIAAIDGYCLGGGNEIAMACGIRVASDQAQFGQPEINLGIMPGMGGTQRLPRLVTDVKKAVYMLVAGNIISARDAHAIRLVDFVVPQKDLIAKTKEIAKIIMEGDKEFDDLSSQLARPERTEADKQKIIEMISEDANFKTLSASKSPDAVQVILRAVVDGLFFSADEALSLEQQLFAELVMKESAKKGLAKFLKIQLPEEKKETVAAPSAPQQAIVPSDLSEEYKLLKETARDFVKNEIRPNVEKMESEEQIPRALFEKMAELGFFGTAFPEKYGGSDFGKTGYCIVMEELSRAHGSTAALVGAHTGLACGAIYIGGTEAQKQKYLRAGLEGKMIGAFALTEPGAGSDAANVQTTAVFKDDKWILNGRKQFITNGDIADFVVVIAQTDKFLGQKGLAAFIVDKGSKGFSVGKIEKKMGIRASRTAGLVFDNVEVSADALLGGVGQGFKIFMQTLNGGRLSLAAGCLGAAKEAFELAYAYASQRQQFDKTLIEFEAIQFYFAEMRAKIYMMEQAVYQAAAKFDQGKDVRLEAAIVKLQCSELGSEVIDTALQVFGGYGYMEEYPIERLYRDARINKLFEGTNEIQKLFIFKEIYSSGGEIE